MIDVLIIGSGGAGLVAAISAKDSGANVTVIGKSFATRSQTSMAQGGINAALANVEEDSINLHVEDTIKSAQGLADENAIKKLCEEAVDAVEWLDRIGLPFSRTKDGKIAQRRLGGASGIRACYAQDYTGLKILHTLYDRASKLGINFINEHFLLNLTKNENNSISGAVFLDIKTGEVVQVEAKSVILATGGYSQLYHNYTTNSTASTGDGLAVALRAGARLSDMEFVQFHPTALKNSAILISESARGAGGYLLNSKNERFTDELAPRDKVARAILEEIENGEDVFLDIRHLGEKFIDHELPQERKLSIMYENIDPVIDIMPIKPVAHYTMGGIEVDEKSMTCIQGLYAVGEVANHNVHGANRLGGNSLLELVVFGREAGKNSASYSSSAELSTCRNEKQQNIDTLEKINSFTNKINFYEKRDFIGKLFYTKVGIKRTSEDLEFALNELEKIKTNIPKMGVKDKSKIYNTNLTEFLEFQNILEIAEAVIKSAINRQESRGAHFRQDKQERDDKNFQAHTIAFKKEGTLTLELVK